MLYNPLGIVRCEMPMRYGFQVSLIDAECRKDLIPIVANLSIYHHGRRYGDAYHLATEVNIFIKIGLIRDG